MTVELTALEHPEFGAIRHVLIDGAPWFVLADVCRALEIGNTSDAARSLDEDEKQQVNGNVDTIDVAPGGRHPWVVNESGLYSLILRSRKPEAKRFKKWVTSEVLPAIRRTGAYTRSKSTLELLRDQVDVAIAHEQRMNELETRQNTVEARVDALEEGHGWTSALGYAKRNGHSTEAAYLRRVGICASALLRSRGQEPIKVHSAVYGEINTYPDEVLREAFIQVR
ncbi:BRO-N domain-containing protein [Nocardiopsis suaedae]|uniref:Bro-N domain-containing protein n=1 Tax=Nocardiopsis suaedae TaxID=3018444 RepID=A0ABT4TM07_9ACTN|nr:Bro-N domain-containing protein [Nocardiopsis suaedae]MDA2805723.1 Bro-N domain-containing protein [Nocardiopsis suaedae]